MGCLWSPGFAILLYTSIAFDALLVYIQRVWLHLLCAFMLCSWRAPRDGTNSFLSSSPQICSATVSFSSHVCCWTQSVGWAYYLTWPLFWRAQTGHTVETSVQQYFLCFKRRLRKAFGGHRGVHCFHWAGHERKSLPSSLLLKAWCSLPFLSISKPLFWLVCKDAFNRLLGWASLRGRLQASR